MQLKTLKTQLKVTRHQVNLKRALASKYHCINGILIKYYTAFRTVQMKTV